MKYCLCDDWQENIRILDGIFGSARIHGVTYNGKFFVYCPWCGTALVEPQTEEEKA
jgi:hypothetical protein